VQPLEIDVQTPCTFLRGLYDLDAGQFVAKRHEQAGAIGVSLPHLLSSLSKNVPGFVEYCREEQGIDLAGEQRSGSRRGWRRHLGGRLRQGVEDLAKGAFGRWLRILAAFEEQAAGLP